MKFNVLFLTAAMATSAIIASEDEPAMDAVFCMSSVGELCPTDAALDTPRSLFAAGERFNCVVANSQKLGEICTKNALIASMEEMKESECKDELHAKCGKSIDELEQDIEEGDIPGAIRAAGSVSFCIIEHLPDFWKKCVQPNRAVDDEVDATKFIRGSEDLLDLKCKGQKDDSGTKCNKNCDGKCCPAAACVFGKCASTTCKRQDSLVSSLMDPVKCTGQKDDFGSKCNHICNGKCCPAGACLFGKCASTTCKIHDNEVDGKPKPDPKCKGVEDNLGTKCDISCDGKCCPSSACILGKCAATSCKKHKNEGEAEEHWYGGLFSA